MSIDQFKKPGAKAPAATGKGVLKANKTAFDPAAWALGEYMGIYNNEGTFQPGSGGTAGYTVSRQAERDQTSAAFAKAEQDRSKVYGEAVSEVKARNPGITAGYDKASADLQANARQRALEAAGANQSRDSDAMNAAAAMGLTAAPPTVNTRADAVAAENTAHTGQIADQWQGFNSSTSQRAVERNNSVADAFTWQGAQQQAALQSLLQTTLSGLVDQYVAGTAGSAGKMVGGSTASQKLSALGKIMSYGNKQTDLDLAAARYNTPTTTTTKNSNGNTSVSVSRKG